MRFRGFTFSVGRAVEAPRSGPSGEVLPAPAPIRQAIPMQGSEPGSCAGNFFGYNSDLESWFFSRTETKKGHVHDLHGGHHAQEGHRAAVPGRRGSHTGFA